MLESPEHPFVMLLWVSSEYELDVCPEVGHAHVSPRSGTGIQGRRGGQLDGSHFWIGNPRAGGDIVLQALRDTADLVDVCDELDAPARLIDLVAEPERHGP